VFRDGAFVQKGEQRATAAAVNEREKSTITLSVYDMQQHQQHCKGKPARRISKLVPNRFLSLSPSTSTSSCRGKRLGFLMDEVDFVGMKIM
jgi:hypothetical protein